MYILAMKILSTRSSELHIHYLTSLSKYLEHLLDSYSSLPNRYALYRFDVRLSKTTFLDTFGWMASLSECSLEMLSPSTTTMDCGSCSTFSLIIIRRGFTCGQLYFECCPPNIWSDDHQPIRVRTTTLLKFLTK